MFKDESEFKKIVNRLNIDTEPNPKHREELRREVLSVFNEAGQQSATRIINLQTIRRKIMKSPVTKIAAAAVIIIAVLIGIHQLGGSTPAFADIVQPLLSARTTTCKITINIKGEPPQTRDCMFMEPGRMRQVMPSGVIRISDKRQGQRMNLYPTEKKAIIYEMTNIPEDKQRQTNWFQQIRECIRQAQETEDESVKFIGKQKIDGVNAIGYHVEERNMDMTVWADAETLLPIRIEYSLASAGAIIEGTITYSDIVVNVELDESLFSIQVPEGYESQTMQYDYEPFKPPGEEDLIQALRLWSGTTNGKFPSELNIETLGEFIQVLKEKMGLKFEKGKASDLSNPKLHEFWRIWRRITRGIGFVSKLPSESDLHYAGKGVKLGDADTPIFWYRPEGSETYRVIYGDLSVKDVAPENLPK
ncbi:hypothetical protein ES703_77840 [subsurface metagenome]